jgi:ferredoxin-NADP reductase
MTDPPAPGGWRRAELVARHGETARGATLEFAVEGWRGHRAGQHVDVRLTAEDGYQAQRSYSISSPPASPRVVLTVERLDDGEVSPYLVDEMRPGDLAEMRGPIGDWFVWEPETTPGPLLLLGGGFGVVPLMAMVRHRAEIGSIVPLHLIVSARSHEELPYAQELDRLGADDSGLEVSIAYTRSPPAGWRGAPGRLDRGRLAELTAGAPAEPEVYVCGPTGFVEAVADALLDLGHDPGSIRAERFGSSAPPEG